jgi:DNA recombination protein RmuC
MENIVYLLIGCVGLGIGAAIGIYIGKNKTVIPEGLVSKETYDLISQNLEASQVQISERDEKIRILTGDLATREESLRQTNERLANQVKEMEEIRTQMMTEFENIAGRILEERSGQFVKNSKDGLSVVLKPFQDRLEDFNKQVREFRDKDIAEKTELKGAIESLRQLNQRLSEDANNLTNALKGDTKLQGDWGEFQMETLLEAAGLERGIHFRMQESFTGEEGNRQRPDCIIILPEDRNLIIDSKVSLTAFVEYFSAETEEEREACAARHLKSVQDHIKELSAKNYKDIYGLNTPDYVLMFIPQEPALAMAMREDGGIFNQAFEKNIVIVTGATLLATMKTVSFIWKQEKQKKNVLEIARVGGSLYDKFVGFVTDLQEIGAQIGKAQLSYEDALKKLSTGQGSLVRQAEILRELGAKVNKKMPLKIQEIALADLQETPLLEENK